MGKKTDDYEAELERLQILLVETQAWTIDQGLKTVIVFEGRDTAGKDGAIKRITEHMALRQTRVVALPKPTERETGQWYFQRYVPHLPAEGEIVLFNRSWYNRAGVEHVMGFCEPDQYARFLKDAPHFERMLVDGGINIIKLWLDITKAEQAGRLADILAACDLAKFAPADPDPSGLRPLAERSREVLHSIRQSGKTTSLEESA